VISANVIRRIAGEEGLDISMLEKDYVLGWILYGISRSSIGKRLAFKGGTALFKIYHPGRWRLSEDLDFTLLDDMDWEIIINALKEEVPGIVKESVGIDTGLRSRPHTNPEYLQARMRYKGPVSLNTIKVVIKVCRRYH
jgi:predicted nucleotidyltransferase component of viral defense system